LYAGLDTVPNMIVGFPVPHLQIVKLSMFGREGQEQPLGSFFPMGFLTPPDHEPMVDVNFSFYHIFPPPVFSSSRGGEGGNLSITYMFTCHDHMCLPLLTCLHYCLIMDAQLILSSPISSFISLSTFSQIITCLNLFLV
jgi:hypothetical protein